MTNIVSWNADGLTNQSKLYEFKLFLLYHNIEIALVQETHLKNHNYANLNMANYILYHTTRENGSKGGTAILVKRNIDHVHLTPPLLENLELTAIKFITKSRSELIVCSAYNSPMPQKRIKIADLNTIIGWAGTTPILIAGDLNAKHPIWNSRIQNQNGVILRQHYEQHGYQIRATEEPTHYPKNQNNLPDVLDIVILQNINHQINLKVLSALESDHNPVIITLGKPKPTKLQRKIINYNKYRDELQTKSYHPLRTIEEIEEAAETMLTNIQLAKAMGTEVASEDTSNTRESEIRELIKQKNKIRQRFQRTRDPFQKRHLNQINKAIKRCTKQLIDEEIEEKIKALNPNDASLYKETKKLLRLPNSNPPLKKANGELAYKSEEKVTIIADYLETVFKSLPLQQTDFDIEYETANYLLEPKSPLEQITVEKTKKLIENLKNKKAPGYDSITNEDLKQLPEKTIQILTQIYNACLKMHYFPQCWKIAKVITFIKPGKAGTEKEDHRPISLLPTCGKLLEKIILEGMSYQVETNNITIDQQYGYRAGHSTTHEISVIAKDIREGLDTKKYTGLVALDGKQAFDKTWHTGILCKIGRIPELKKFLHILRTYLSNRQFFVANRHSKSSTRKIEASVAQGGLLSPMLFSLYMNDIPQTNQVKLAIYADDITFYTTDKNPVIVSSRLNEALEQLHSWQIKWKMITNQSKSKATLFTRTRNPPQMNPLQMGTGQITWGPEIKILGVTLDRKLNWKAHIADTLTKASKRRGMLLPLIRARSPTALYIKRLIYIQYIRTIVTYAAPAWQHLSNQLQTRLQVFQNKTLRLITNAPWYVRNSILHHDLEIEYLDQLIRDIANTFYTSCRASQNSIISQLTY